MKEDKAPNKSAKDKATDELKASPKLPSLRLPKPSQPGSTGGPALPPGLMRTSLASLPAVKAPTSASASVVSAPDDEDDGPPTQAIDAASVARWSLDEEPPTTELGDQGTSADEDPEIIDEEDAGPPTDNVSASALDGIVFADVTGLPEATSAERSSLLDATPLLSADEEAGPDEATMMAPGLLSDSDVDEDDLDSRTQVAMMSEVRLAPRPDEEISDDFEGDGKTTVLSADAYQDARAPEPAPAPKPAPQVAQPNISRMGTAKLPALERPASLAAARALSGQAAPAPAPNPNALAFGATSLPFESGASGLNGRPKPTLLEFQYGAAPTAADPVAAAAAAALPEGDDDLDGLKTEMLFNPFTRDVVAPKLRAVEGPALGQEFFVNGLKCTVGRGENNTLMVADLSMSRHHFEVVRNPDESFFLKDLGSANGTSLQGTRIKEVALFDGDRIEAGQSTFIFSHASSPPQQHRHMILAVGETLAGAPSPVVMSAQTGRMFSALDQSSRVFTVITLIAGALCMPLIGLLIYLSTRPSAPVAPAPAGQVAPAGGAQSADLFMQGVQAVKMREWDQAQAHFTRAKALTPTLDVGAQLSRIDRERTAQSKLEAAQRAGEAGDLDKAHALASEIPGESVYAEEARRWIRRAKVSGVDALYATAQQQFTADKIPEALATIDELLRGAPDHQATLELRKLVVARGEELERLRLEQEAKAAREAAVAANPVVAINDPFSADKGKPVDKPATPAQPTIQSDWNEGLALYKSEKFGEAATFFDKVGATEPPARAAKAKRMANDLRLLQKSWRDGKAAADKADWDNAAKKLDQALRADGRLGGAHKKAIGDVAAASLAKQGLELVKKEDYRGARKMLLDARKIASTPAAGELDRALEDKATSLYIKAASARKGNDVTTASTLCRTIMLMVPSSSPSYAKAQKLLLEL